MHDQGRHLEVNYGIGEWPEVVILMLTWAGDLERPEIAELRLGYAQQAILSLKKHLHYPNLSWHIADDGSPKAYQEKILALLGEAPYTFSDTKKGWDINNNWNTGLEIAFGRTDLVWCWPDDRFLVYDIDLKPYVCLLMSYEDIGIIRLRRRAPKMVAEPIERCRKKWWLVKKNTSGHPTAAAALTFKHRRFIDAYGYLKVGIWPPIQAAKLSSKHFNNTSGPAMVIPDQLWKATEIPWGGTSTWEWPRHSGKPYRKLAPWNTE